MINICFISGEKASKYRYMIVWSLLYSRLIFAGISSSSRCIVAMLSLYFCSTLVAHLLDHCFAVLLYDTDLNVQSTSYVIFSISDTISCHATIFV